MDLFYKAVAGVIICLILTITLSTQGKSFTVLLSIAVCGMIVIGALSYITDIFAFVRRLQLLGNLDSSMIGILLKIVGIGILSEICAMICQDGGQSAYAKAIQMMSSALIIWLSMPLFSELLTLLEDVLGAL